MSILAIQPIGTGAQRLTASLAATSRTSRTDLQVKQIDTQVLQTALTIDDQDAETNLVVENTSQAKGHGVLRLLNEGHFKGVADVRLRINFSEQLSAQQEQQSLANLNEQTMKFVGSISDSFHDSISTLTDEEETQATLTSLLSDFESTLQGTLGDISISDLDPAALETSIQTSFDSFVEQLSQTLAVPDLETETDSETVNTQSLNTSALLSDTRLDETKLNATTEETTILADQTVETTNIETTSSQDDSLSLFKEAFSQALTEFISSLKTTSSTSQELSFYDGNGAAYDKFLAIYNNLNGVSTTVDELI